MAISSKLTWPAQALVIGLSEDLRQGESRRECPRSAQS